MREEGIFLALGRCDYSGSWELQHRLWAGRVKQVIPDTVLFLEHHHTITLGRRGDRSHVKASSDVLEDLKIPVIHTERGGDVTYHGPGQAILYPIMRIREYGLSATQYIERLEDLILRVLKDFAIDGRRNRKNRGIWVGNDKVASIGVSISRGVSFHGVALNYSTDLSYFDLIDACGLKDQRMTSIAHVLGREVSQNILYQSLQIHFGNLFENDWQEKSLDDIEGFLPA